MSNEVLVKEGKAAEVLNVSPEWLKKRRMRKLPPRFVRISKKAIRYRITDLHEFIESRTVEPQHGEEATT